MEDADVGIVKYATRHIVAQSNFASFFFDLDILTPPDINTYKRR